MEASADFYTVFRSMDSSAQEDCQAVIEELSSQGLHPTLADDSAPGVPEGVYEVRVPAAEAAAAEELAGKSTENAEPGDASEALDLETIAKTSEVEALGIQSLLEDNGITAVLVGDSVLPNIPFEVRVARQNAEAARKLVVEAEEDGPAAAAEAEAAGETAALPPQA